VRLAAVSLVRERAEVAMVRLRPRFHAGTGPSACPPVRRAFVAMELAGRSSDRDHP